VESAAAAWSHWSTRVAVRTWWWCSEWRGTDDTRRYGLGRADTQVESRAIGLVSWPINENVRMDGRP
jgi:hypothetical protein